MTIREKTSAFYTFSIIDVFDKLQTTELNFDTRSKIVEKFKKLATFDTFQQKILKLERLLTKKNTFTMIQLVSIFLKSLKLTKDTDIYIINSFFEWSVKSLPLENTQIFIESLSILDSEIENASAGLVEQLETYNKACENLSDETFIVFNILELRKALFKESKKSKNVVSLLIADKNLEKKQIKLLENIIQNIDEKNT